MNLEGRLNQLESELGEENQEYKLENGDSVYLTEQEELEAFVDAMEVNIGAKTLEEAGEKTKKLLSADPNQNSLVAHIQELIENAEENSQQR